MRIAVYIACVVLLWCVGLPAFAGEDAALWQALRDGRAVALLRHAEAPGTGDPPDFRLDDCATQRNLSEAGRRQAQALGDLFRRNGIDRAVVLSSAWCRARDTATLMDLGRVEVAPALASLHGRSEHRDAQIAELRRLIDGLPPNRPAILASHQATIAALTGVYPGNGGIVVVERRDGLPVMGRLAMP